MNTSDEARDPKDEDAIIRFLEVEASLLHTRQGICKLASDHMGPQNETMYSMHFKISKNHTF